ncbi:liprin-beta-1-like isoform X2 [Pomacea canaliculata]|uniref:liprin-beta-1-like isoform X2 n=1 Tax=Pomacea canaliculata TaxID=400727 RepID=UPI000D7289A9|nr:liprin-beta-1-like isoform X2 [Pomacea canaliculata]XP_025088370.1 liprin-beta-1-like isoform X2 [Pomacea canaliculata]
MEAKSAGALDVPTEGKTFKHSQELLTHTTLETHKLDLMAEISNLKLRLASSEKDRRELDERCRMAQRQITELEAKLLIKDAEMAELRQRLIRNGTLLLPEPGGEASCDRTLEREKTLDRLKRKQTEVEKLKKAVDALMLSNEDKDRRLDDMRRLLKRYRRVEEILVQAQGRKAVEELLQNIEDDTSSNSSTTPSIHDTSLRDSGMNDEYRENRHGMSSPSATSTPVHNTDASRFNGNASVVPVHSLPASARQALGMTRSNSCENIAASGDKGPQEGKKKESNSGIGGSYGTLPKHSSSYGASNREGASIERDISGSAKRNRGFPTLSKTLLRIRSGKRSSSAPNLAHTEVVTDDEDGLQHMGVAGPIGVDHKKRRGLRRLFGRLKRSSSQDFEGGRDRHDGEFRRGGVRATATARLGWSQRSKLFDTDTPFARWDGDRVMAWLNEIGLNMYLGECKRWVRNGEQLLRASAHDLEKDLGMKNPLHRKKLQLALQAIGSEKGDHLSLLDHNFIARWLDDIGLPQYKDLFYDARVDGRMLHYLTVDDLLALKVTNELHHISIKRGIQILRLNAFNPSCLRRRPFPEELNQPIQNQPGEVMLWTNHRVMEWLRTIDLSEYAPNLRGSGVHGALMVLEPRFNAELFAQLLSIPTNKTLLRRHLSTHFVGIIGPETQTRKREFESLPGYQPLLVNAKVKKGKFGLFGHKRSKSETEADGFICPMDGQNSQGTLKNGTQGDARAAQEIGAMSKEINSLTTMLSQERFLDSAKTSNV